MADFDKKYRYLKNNRIRNGVFEALIVIDHDNNWTQEGLHAHHDEKQEVAISEFVNKFSISILDDLNADTLQAYSMIDDPLLLVFVDLEMWEKDQKEAEHQRKYLDTVHKELYYKVRAKAVTVLVPIDDSEEGNRDIREMFGISDPKEYSHSP